MTLGTCGTPRTRAMMRRCGAAAIAVLSPALASAQDYNPAQTAPVTKARVPGPPFVLAQIKDRLEIGNVENDAIVPDDNVNRVYLLTVDRGKLDKGTAIQIDATSSEFDTFLQLFEPGKADPLLDDDNGGGGRNARLIIPPEIWVKPAIVVVSARYDGSGRFLVNTSKTAFVPPVPPTPLPLDGKPIEAALSAASMRRVGLDVPIARYAIKGVAGTRVQIDVKSSDFDPSTEIYVGEAFIGRDADSGEGANSRLIRTFDTSGEHILTILSPDGRLGRYSVAAAVLPAPGALPAEPYPPLTEGHSVSGALEVANPAEDDRSYAVYSLTGQAGQVFEVTLVGMDATGRGRKPEIWLEAGQFTDAGFATVARGVDTPASVRITFRKTGSVVVRALGAKDFLGSFELKSVLLDLKTVRTSNDER